MTSGTSDTKYRQPGEASPETERALLIERLSAMTERIKVMEDHLDKIEAERQKALLWGIRLLGTALIGLVAWAASMGLFKGHAQ